MSNWDCCFCGRSMDRGPYCPQCVMDGNALQWTTEPPTKPGWYLGWSPAMGEPFLMRQGKRGARTYHDGAFWWGPIPEPEE